MKNLGQCSICTEKTANYKCPKCLIVYCSLACYKSPDHKHEVSETRNDISKDPVTDSVTDSGLVTNSSLAELDPKNKNYLFSKIAQDPQIKSLLACKALQVHLAVLVRLLEDSLLTNEPMAENRREIANMRLCELRKGGCNENSLIEEFVERLLQVQDEVMNS